MMLEAVAVIAAVMGAPVTCSALKAGSGLKFTLSFDCSKMNVPAVPVDTTWIAAARRLLASVALAPATASSMLLMTAVCAAWPTMTVAGSTTETALARS